MTRTTYDEIRKAVVLSADSNAAHKLEDFKELYRRLINSARVTSRIRSFEELARILEKRRWLSEENVEVLHNIASALNNPELVLRIECYEGSRPATVVAKEAVAKRQRGTVVVSASGQELKASTYQFNDVPQLQPVPQLPSAPFYVPRLPPEAVEVVSEEIGTSWKSFARLISVKEGEIDNLVSRCDMSIKEKTVKCLEIFETRTRHVDVRKTLHDALRKVRRNDVCEQIDHMLINSGLH